MTVSSVIPTLRYRDARAAIRFLVDGLGFRLTASYPEDENAPVDHAELVFRDGMVMLGTAGRGEVDVPVGGASVYLVVDTDDEVDRLHSVAVQAGAESVRRPRDEDYGGRGASVRDSDGVTWSIGSYQPAG